MDESIEKFFRSIPVGRRTKPNSTGNLWCPAADVIEAPDGWIVKVELAGVSPSELSIKIAGRELLLTGVRRDGVIVEGATYHQMEITYSRFHRKLTFPCELAANNFEQHYRDGLLILRLQRADKAGG